MKVLLCGAAGFVLSNFAFWFLQKTDYEVVSVDNLSSTPDLKKLSIALDSRKRHKFHLSNLGDNHITKKILELEKPDLVISVVKHPEVLFNLVEGGLKVGSPRLMVIDDIENSYLGCKRTVDGLRSYNNYPIAYIKTCRLFGPRSGKSNFVYEQCAGLLSQKDVDEGSGEIFEWMYIQDLFLGLIKAVDNNIENDLKISSGFAHSEKDIGLMLRNIYSGDPANNTQLRFGAPEKKYLCEQMDELKWFPKYGLLSSLEHTLTWFNENPWAVANEQ